MFIINCKRNKNMVYKQFFSMNCAFLRYLKYKTRMCCALGVKSMYLFPCRCVPVLQCTIRREPRGGSLLIV